MNNKLIILRGNSGSGKSTTAKELQKKFGRGTFLIPQDIIRRELLYAKDGADTSAIKLLSSMVSYGKQNCEIVILEGILKSEWYKPLFQRATQEFGDDIYAYYFDIPFEETLKRHQEKANVHEFGEKEMKRWWNEKDYIGTIKEKNLHKDQSLSEIVELIYDDVRLEDN